MENTDAPASSDNEPAQTTAEAPASSDSSDETTVTTDETKSNSTDETTTKATLSTESTETTVKEVTDSKLSAPKIGEFKVSTVEGADGQTAVVTWEAVEGAEGYQVYRTIVEEFSSDTPTSYAFDVNTTAYQTSGSIAYKETIKVRAYRLKEDGTRAYGAWSSNATVYLNGMKQDETTATAKSTTTDKTTTTTKKSTTATTAKKTDSSSTSKTNITSDGEPSPKTGDTSSLPAIMSSLSAALIAGAASKKKKK